MLGGVLFTYKIIYIFFVGCYNKVTEENMIVKFKSGDILIMKKKHPCGCVRLAVVHTGSDVKLRCLSCAHDIIVPRIRIEKNIRQVIPGEEE